MTDDRLVRSKVEDEDESVIAVVAGVWMIMVGVMRLVAAFGRFGSGAVPPPAPA